MGSPVSVVVAEIVMQHIEKRALATCDQTLHFWFRYVGDTITISQTDDIGVFHGHLNRQNSDIQFTRELEDNGKIPFLDCLVSRDDTRLMYLSRLSPGGGGGADVGHLTFCEIFFSNSPP